MSFMEMALNPMESSMIADTGTSGSESGAGAGSPCIKKEFNKDIFNFIIQKHN